MKKHFLLLLTISFGFSLANCTPDALSDEYAQFSFMPPVTQIVHPYNDIDFSNIQRLKANLHTHTRISDGKQTADEMIRAYAERGYDIVAITDHENLYAKNTGLEQVAGREVLVVRGIEITMTHHMNAIFTNRGNGNFLTVESAISSYADNSNCVLIFNHPGRHSWMYSFGFYVDMYSKFSAEKLVGMEVVNSQDEYPPDKDLWHKILSNISPSRTVFGYANDDAHSYNEIGYSFNEFLTNDFTEEGVRKAIVNGVSFFYSKATVPMPMGPTPFVHDVIIDPEAMTITVDAEFFDTIEWRSCGIVVSKSNTVVINKNPERDYNLGRYVQFTLTGKGGQLFSQPFLLI
ncbi:MAG: PHP domain-containing protein [Prevotellaceae bacterium]|nr:PHP domain-containing protein [Prevotellaceae bacterium]